MTHRLRLETFDVRRPAEEVGTGRPADTGAGLEEVRLTAYESGYAAGWEDAARAHAEDQFGIRDDLANNLRDLSFTFQEARAHVLRALEPLLVALVDRVLPELARATLGQAVLAEITAAAPIGAGARFLVSVAPQNRAAVEAALGEDPPLAVQLVEDPGLADGQVHLRVGDEERLLDLDAVLVRVRGLIRDFLSTHDERLAHHG